MPEDLPTAAPPIPGVPPLHAAAGEAAAKHQVALTKPPGSLGMLEQVGVRLAAMTGSLDPALEDAVVFTLAADHGVVEEGVSAYPQEVTGQMVLNFLSGGAAVTVLARTLGARVVVADLGVAADLPAHPGLRSLRIRRGSRNLARGPALTLDETRAALNAGRRLVREELEAGLDLVLTGDMGIGNTTPSACLVCHFTGLDPLQVVGRGTGVDDAGLARKTEVVRRALEVNAAAAAEPLGALAALGGLEIAGLTGVILEAVSRRRPVLLDGFISTAAALAAAALVPGCQRYLIAAHRSQELGHAAALAALDLRPLLDLELRLGEGTGALLALPLVRAAIRIQNEMATFEEAGVSDHT
ncbi:MAG: nicotinate-nucleotide--dimethylbenzimidazole phosphoribosyltransferase [Candidatus Dormibacteraeota bacterium]|nr:nicotinate-nucleotide--dimethylbenzimidazole phosphoribosyltransferase [Candidatus Dormibacteraeota bacterium]